MDVLFDILSQQKVDSGDTFDEAFYLDQKGPRKLWISKELNPDFQHQLEQQQKTEANKERRRRLACGETSETQHDTQHDDLSDDELHTAKKLFVKYKMNIFFLLSRLTSQCKNLLLICCCLDPGHQLLVNILQLKLKRMGILPQKSVNF